MQTATPVSPATITSLVRPPGEEPADPLATLRQVQVAPRILQGFRPLAESLEWELSELYWRSAGVNGFQQNEVPYTINNSGLLSHRAAALLLANCLEAASRGPITLLEVGAGTGLFARNLLGELAHLCRREGHDAYDRVTFYVTDRSPRTVAQWRDHAVFAGHEARVVTAICDARDPRRGHTLEGAPLDFSGVRAVFANYVLDSLPCTIVRRGEGGPQEMVVRTHLTGDAARVAQYTTMDLDELRALAAAEDPAERLRLLPLVSLFEFETAFSPCGQPHGLADEALAVARDADRAILNYAASECLERACDMLAPDGFVLVNDYGCVAPDQMAAQAVTQRFGSSAALGLNFPHLEHHFEARGQVVVRPEEDAILPVHPRLLVRGGLPRTRRAFLEAFDGPAHRAVDAPLQRARAHIEAGRFEQTKAEYEQALARHPRDWRLLGEVAEFLNRQVADYASALKLARAALDLNPWYSAWLWNVLGDALFALDRYLEAHEAYQRALAIDAVDPRTFLNLAYIHVHAGDHPAALDAVARGLACDRAGMFRERLLEKQAQVLALVTAKYAGEQDWLGRRAARLLKP